MEYYKYFKVTGVANSTVYDSGLSSSMEAPKRLLGVMVNVTAHKGNKIQGWLEREKVFELPDYLIDTQEAGAVREDYKSFNKLNEIPVGVDMPVGTTFKTAIECGADATDIYGAYRYEIVS